MSGHLEPQQQHDLAAYLDALPYAEQQQATWFTDAHLQQAADLIRAEVALQAGNQAEHPNLPPAIIDVTSIKHAPEKLNAIDTARYRLAPPSGEDETRPEAWIKATELAQAMVEQQHNRLVNLELMNQFAAKAWQLHAFQLEKFVSMLEKEVEYEVNQTTNLNKRRKLDQLKTGQSLSSLEYRWGESVSRLFQIEVATKALEAEIEKLERTNKDIDHQET